MDELDHGGGFGVPQVAAAARPGSHDDDQRPQALAAGPDDVFGDLVHQHDVAGQPGPDDLIDLPEVLVDQCFDGLETHAKKPKGDAEW